MKQTLTVTAAVTALVLGTTAGALAGSHVEILSPVADSVAYGDTLDLVATATSETSVNVAVRATTEVDDACTPGTSNVLYRDVTGELATDVNGLYAATMDISGAAPGLYCFAFDPADAPRISQKFFIADGRVAGGGQMLEGAFKVSFGGEAYAIQDTSGTNIDGVGSWTVRFHDVSTDGVSGTTFSGDHVRDMNFFVDGSVANLEVVGTWDGVAGHELTVRAEDGAEPGGHDNLRFELRDPSGVLIYDTFGGDFPGESNNVGTARTGLDRGNLQVDTR